MLEKFIRPVLCNDQVLVDVNLYLKRCKRTKEQVKAFDLLLESAESTKMYCCQDTRTFKYAFIFECGFPLTPKL
jgi:hypothetical protein